MAMRIDGAAAVHGPTGGNAATPAPVLLAGSSGGGRHAARSDLMVRVKQHGSSLANIMNCSHDSHHVLENVAGGALG